MERAITERELDHIKLALMVRADRLQENKNYASHRDALEMVDRNTATCQVLARSLRLRDGVLVIEEQTAKENPRADS